MAIGKYSKDIEKKWVEKWEEEGTYRFKEGTSPTYVIDAPPPFTSGKLHMGHILSFTMFDIAARFKRMTGYNVLYAQGWDTQGFPTEVKVEAKYGRLPREEFIRKCHEWTEEHITHMREQAKRFGFSADWRREYKTMDPSYHEKVQRSLIEMYGKGDVYRGEHPVFYCPNCHSAIAKAETEEIERETVLYDVEFEVEGKPLIIATTRPELMHAVVAVTVHPEDDRYRGLVGKTVKTPLGKEVPLIADEDVDKEFGSGAVMIATFGDKQDVVWMYRHNLPYVKAMDEYGRIINSGIIDGVKVSKAKEAIVEKLREMGKIKGEKKLKQVVKIHDRCKKPAELLMSKQWFAKIIPYKEEIERAAKTMEWFPAFGIHYMLDWLNTLEWDWVISRQRHFGTPLPFYYCESCDKTAPADELPFYPEKAPAKKCECGGNMIPETSVADCWVDSSITPLVVAGWPEQGWENLYPSDLRPQGIEIVRTWAFYTTYRCLRLTGEKPFKTILLHGHVLGPDGKKMSKSLGNVVDPQELLEKYSADAVRLWVAFSGSLERDRPFNYDQVKRMQNLVNKIWNASRFVSLALEGFDGKKPSRLRDVDEWIISRFSQVSEIAHQAIAKFDYYKAITAITDFFWEEFCDDYLEFVKYRIYNNKDKQAAQYALHTVLEGVLRLYAPFAPFITEELYRSLFSTSSVHLAEYPQGGEVNEESLKVGEFLSKAIRDIRKEKKSKGLSIKDMVPQWEVELPVSLKGRAEMLAEEIQNIAFVEKVLWK